MRDEDKSKEQLIEELKKLRQQGSTDITERKLAQQALVEREQLFNHAAQIASLGHFVWDEQEDRCIYASEEYARIHGLTVDEVLTQYNGDKDILLVHPKDRERILATYEEYYKQTGSYDFEYGVITPGGEERYVRGIWEPVFDDQSRITRTVGILQDITEWKNVQEAKAESEQLLKQSASLSKLGHAHWDRIKDEYISVSDEYAHIFGYTAEEFLDRFMTHEQDMQLVHPDDRAKVHAFDQSLDTSRKALDFRILHRDGSIRHVSDGQLITTKLPYAGPNFQWCV